jgi:hypothetical protein
MSGYGADTFGPNDSITREQLVTILWRYAGSPAATQETLNFIDADQAAMWSRDALLWATENGVISGKGNNILDPRGLATRAEVAQMMMNLIEHILGS